MEFSEYGGKVWANPTNLYRHLDIVDPEYYKGCKIVYLTLLTDNVKIPAEKLVEEMG